MTGTVVATLAAVAFFLLLIAGAVAGFGLARLPPRARAAVASVLGVTFPLFVYLAVRVVDEAEALRPLADLFDRHRAAGLRLTLSAAVLGFSLFMGGILHLLLTAGPSEGFTLRQMSRALRSGRWLRSTVWRRRVVVTTGVALLTLGLFGIFVVVGPPGVKLFLISCFLYGAGAGALALRRRVRDGGPSGARS